MDLPEGTVLRPATSAISTLLRIEGAVIAAVAILALWTVWPDVRVLWLTAIWTFHIGFDRTLGYGLKSPEGFRVTHLQRV